MKRFLPVFLCFVLLCTILAPLGETKATNFSMNGVYAGMKIKVGLYYGSDALTNANLQNVTGYGSGYRLGYYDQNRNFNALGQIYNVEGHGSNDAKILGLSLYGTSKRAITYFTEALAHEAKELNTNVLVGKITPGIMITNFITTALGDGEKIELDPKTKKVYNILGDYPETIAEFMVEKIISNKKNNVKFTWLTNRRAAMRFMTAGFKKRNFFN